MGFTDNKAAVWFVAAAVIIKGFMEVITLDIKNLSEEEIRNCLENIGCNKSLTEQFAKGEMSKRNVLDILYKQRVSALDKLHLSQDKLDCIDYLIYQIRKAD